MKPRLYLETTIPSYLAARKSGNPIRFGHQQITREWRRRRRKDFEVVVSDVVLRECERGDPAAAADRLALLADLSVLMQTSDAARLAKLLMKAVKLPKRAAVDALQIAIAAVNGIDYLLTWNCTHIANATLRYSIETACMDWGFQPPIICTPDELLPEADDGIG